MKLTFGPSGFVGKIGDAMTESETVKATIREDWQHLPTGAWFYCFSPSCQFPHSVMERTDSGCTAICNSPWTHPGVPDEFRGIAERHNALAASPEKGLTPQVTGQLLRESMNVCEMEGGNWQVDKLSKLLNAALNAQAGAAPAEPPVMSKSVEKRLSMQHQA